MTKGTPRTSPEPSPLQPSAQARDGSGDVDITELLGQTASPSRAALAEAAAASGLVHRTPKMSSAAPMANCPPRPMRLHSGDLATEAFPGTGGGSMITPVARLNSMSTPVSRSVSIDFEEPQSKGTPVRRRVSSDLSWHEDALSAAFARRGFMLPKVCGSEESSPKSQVDFAARHHVTLSEDCVLSRVCCIIPGMCLFGMILIQTLVALVSKELFLCTTGVLTSYVFCWTTNLAVFSAIGAWRMRRDASRDWHAEVLALQEKAENRDAAEVTHIVILPNYKEDEEMMEETLANIGRSPLAKGSIYIVLGMEEREGDEGREKADRLVSKTSHMFAGLFAAFHPTGRAGEVAGKSSNTQWAFREARRHFADMLVSRDPTRVFVSVGDADTMWNPQYFDALTYEGLTKTSEELAWRMWQPPMLLFRNLFAVPGLTRLSGFGTLLFELSSLANQNFGPAFVFSSYSMTLALASHRQVNGWDTDVIAEDHHMFCKCYFAALWDAVERNTEDGKKGGEHVAVGKVRVDPIYLPAEGFLVESSEGYWNSLYARFQQARRHMQGVAELSYTIMQYWRLMGAAKGNTTIPLRTHISVIAIIWKMAMIHIINNVQATSLVIAMALAAAGIIAKISADGFVSMGFMLFEQGLAGVGATGYSAYELAKWGLFATFGPAPVVGFISGTAVYIVVRDVIQGRYARLPKSALAVDDSPEAAAQKEANTNLTLWQSLKLGLHMQLDMFVLGEPTIVVYGLVPGVMACWSLMRRGSDFEYIVAIKPGDKPPQR